jgi:hypothetical protein
MYSSQVLRLTMALVALIIFFAHVAAHVELSSEDLAVYHSKLKRDSEALNQCLQSPEMREHNVHMLTRRDETLHNLRAAHGKNSSHDYRPDNADSR